MAALSEIEASTGAEPAGQWVSFPGSPFQLLQQFEPAGDQPAAIAQLVEGIEDGLSFQTRLGVTGSGKTFTMANVIAQSDRPTLIMVHNKILAAQLYGELKELFPGEPVSVMGSGQRVPSDRRISCSTRS